MYLNRWFPYFNMEIDVPSAILVWVKLPHLPLHCWSDYALCCIGNSMEKYIDTKKPKESIFTYAKICVEVDLEKGIPEAVKYLWITGSTFNNLTMNNFPSSANLITNTYIFLKIAKIPKANNLRPLKKRINGKLLIIN
jgi:hypothetical protein